MGRDGDLEADGAVEFLLALGSAGPAGVAPLLARAWRGLADEVRPDGRDLVLALRAGTAPPPRPALLLAAHRDTVGLAVTGYLPGGRLRFRAEGGLHLGALLGREVVVAGRRPVAALVCRAAGSAPGSVRRRSAPSAAALALDCGLPDAELAATVRPGDRAAFADGPLRLLGGAVAAPGLDNRAGLAALQIALAATAERRPAADVWFAANAGEETGRSDLPRVAADLRPAAAFVVDAGIAAQPGVDPDLAPGSGRGPALTHGPGLHPALGALVAAEARRLDLPLQAVVTEHPSGTDAWALRAAPGGGVPVALLGIPVRALHTAAETCDAADVACAGAILAAAVAAATPAWLGGLTRVVAGRPGS